MAVAAMPGIEARLRRAVGPDGEVLFDAFSRGRYATDASAYQMLPAGVVIPRTMEAAIAALAAARDAGLPVTARGGGTSQCGQTINSGLIIDGSKHLDRLLDLDVAGRRCRVEPGIVLDDLNRRLRPHGLWFPVDVSTASRATIGGMAGNNSCGGRSLRYGTMRDNVLAIDAVLADGTAVRFDEVAPDLSDLSARDPRRALFADLLTIGAREAGEVAERFPKVQRRVGGYNLDALAPGRNRLNLAHILVGSEGTLAYSTAIELKLWPLMGKRALGVCHFGSFFAAMDAAQHLVKLRPIAVELVDETMIGLARDIAMFRPTLEACVKGSPAALLLVEFDDGEETNRARMRDLSTLMGDLGFAWDKPAEHFGGVVEVWDARLQTAITDLRTSGLNIMMSMKEERKPVSFVEDCAVPLEHLADYTRRLTDVFTRHGTKGTWYAHASEGCLHVRPVLNLKQDKDLAAMRAIAEEAFALVRAFKGSHSGEHGDGIVRSEFHRTMFGDRIVRGFEEVKDRFDPAGHLNPGKIVRAPRFDDRTLLRYPAHYRASDHAPALDWSAWPGGAQGLQGAAEMCNNNGACRKLDGGVMCPSYSATRDEAHVTRGRANVLRLALSGALGPDALAGDEMAEAMSLCVSCKACRRECPTGVDMARMKIEVSAARAEKRGYSLRDRLVGWLPRYAPYASRMPTLMNLRDRTPGAAWLTEKLLGLAADRELPRWRWDIFDEAACAAAPPDESQQTRDVVLFADTFNRYFERERIEAAVTVLHVAGYRVVLPETADEAHRPLCCGRTFLSVGNVAEARRELGRTLAALSPYVARGVPIIGLEPSCLLTFRDEAQALLPGPQSKQLADSALLFEEFIAREADAGRFSLPLAAIAPRAALHGHCHQKAFGAMPAIERTLRLVPGLDVETIETSCCGMAGSFGYQAETLSVSRAMGERALLPAVRAEPATSLIVADGTSCRHQIADHTGRAALHVAQVLAQSHAAARRRSSA
ncbi:MAG: FAD-binding protein [Hyphomicrobiales bacterium]|nr:FAD-binding protein [Hyphomicrobiales bacterium]